MSKRNNEVRQESDSESNSNEENSTSLEQEVSSETISFEFTKLKDDKKTEITSVYHISDIHIRNTQRHEEYRQVFNKLFDLLKSKISNPSKSIIVVTGDIMHTKTEMSPESVTMAQNLFSNLCAITTVILIPGNHDCNLSNKDRLDALSPIVYGNGGFNNLYYLKQSGIYQFYNIVFGVTSVLGDKLVSADCIDDEIWKNVKQKNKYKIALYHGPVHGCKTDVGFRMNNEQLLAEHFDGYDYTMLGDIHRYQYMDSDKTIAYAGSLIQQTYGEKLTGHGVLKWDLINEESELFEIKNDYGFCTINIVDGKMIPTKIPRKPRIRFILQNSTQLDYQNVVKQLSQSYQICEIIQESNLKTQISRQSDPTSFKEHKTLIAQESVINSYLVKKGIPETKITDLLSLHKKLHQKMVTHNSHHNLISLDCSSKTQKWKLLTLEFSNIMSYGKGNSIDFTKYDENKIIGILAPNRHGKSAILDIILFCLFDKCSRGERKDIMNVDKDIMKCSLTFSIGDTKYLIVRDGIRNKDGKGVKVNVDFSVLENGKTKYRRLNGLDKNDTNKKIQDIVGDYNDYVMTCFAIQQGKTSNFLDLTQVQKKEYLNTILRLNIFEDCSVYARNKLKKLSAKIKLLEQQIGSKQISTLIKEISSLTEENENLAISNSSNKLTLSEINNTLETTPYPSINKYNELSEYDLTSNTSINIVLSSLHSKLKEETHLAKIEETTEKIKSNKTKLFSLEEQLSTLIKKSNIDELNAQKEKLLAQIINIPKNIDLASKDKLLESVSNHNILLRTVDEKLNTLKNSFQSQKFDQISIINNEISDLRKTLKPELPINNDYKQNSKKYIEIQINIIEHMSLLLKNSRLSASQISEEQIKQSIHEKFENYLTESIATLNSDPTPSVSSKKVVTSHSNWVSKSKKQRTDMSSLIKLSSTPNMKIDNLLLDSSKYLNLITNHITNTFSIQDNIITNCKIENLYKKLDDLKHISDSKLRIELLEAEKKSIQSNISSIKSNLESIKMYTEYSVSNKQITNSITNILNEISEKRSAIDYLSSSITDLTKQTRILEDFIVKHNSLILQKERIKSHIIMIYDYQLRLFDYQSKLICYTRRESLKREYEIKISNTDQLVERNNTKLEFLNKEIKEHSLLREQYDSLVSENNLYQLYVQTMNYNGIPYEILKTYLPIIESDINQILHSMAKFNIEFKYHSDSNKVNDTNIGCIDINICYPNAKPRTVHMISGFEKFIIGLAIRMALSHVSLKAKPNLFIIDEGWGCLDYDNLANVSSVLNYVKSQYEHVIIISHLEELRNQVDHIINIEMRNEVSYVRTKAAIQTKK